MLQFAFDNLVTVSTHLSNNRLILEKSWGPSGPDFLAEGPFMPCTCVDSVLVWDVFVAYVWRRTDGQAYFRVRIGD